MRKEKALTLHFILVCILSKILNFMRNSQLENITKRTSREMIFENLIQSICCPQITQHELIWFYR